MKNLILQNGLQFFLEIQKEYEPIIVLNFLVKP